MSVGRTLSLRPVDADHAELLYEIYASTRQEELAPLDWDASVKEAFLRQQFWAQDSFYRATYLQASYDLIVDGEQVLGRLYVNRGEDTWLVLDIALLAVHRGNGIGTHLMQELIAEAQAAGKPLQIHVERFNPARRLYERLEFEPVEDQGMYLLYERRPAGAGHPY